MKAEWKKWKKEKRQFSTTINIEIIQSGYDLFRDFPVSPIPVYFLAGRHDHETPGTLAEAYYNFLEAPTKNFTWFENSAHNHSLGSGNLVTESRNVNNFDRVKRN